MFASFANVGDNLMEMVMLHRFATIASLLRFKRDAMPCARQAWHGMHKDVF